MILSWITSVWLVGWDLLVHTQRENRIEGRNMRCHTHVMSYKRNIPIQQQYRKLQTKFNKKLLHFFPFYKQQDFKSHDEKKNLNLDMLQKIYKEICYTLWENIFFLMTYIHTAWHQDWTAVEHQLIHASLLCPIESSWEQLLYVCKMTCKQFVQLYPTEILNDARIRKLNIL